MESGSDASPIIIAVTQPSTAVKLGVRVGFRPAVVMYWEIAPLNGDANPGIVFDNEVVSIRDSQVGLCSARLDSAAANANVYTKIGSDDANGIVINDLGFTYTEAIASQGGDVVVFMIFRNSISGPFENDSVFFNLNRTDITSETFDRDKSEDGNLFKINSVSGTGWHESGAMIEVLKT